jgi:type IV pilus assembly protein PilA
MPRHTDRGFTLVELMTVVLIIGILVTMAVPVYRQSEYAAQRKSCQANQRTISGAANLVMTDGDDYSGASAGQFTAGGSGWYAILVPGWIQRAPTCPTGDTLYYLNARGEVTGDSGNVELIKPGHALL